MARQTVCILLPEDDRTRLKAIVGDRSRPFKHVQRARIVLASDRKPQVLEVAEQVGCSRPAVWRWQQRYAEEGVDGLLRDKTRRPGGSAPGRGVGAPAFGEARSFFRRPRPAAWGSQSG